MSTLSGPKVGVASIITNSAGRILIGKRKSSHGAGKYQLPGGHLEYGETPFQCAEREGEEETGLKVRGQKMVHVTNDIFEAEQKHYVTLFVWCEMEDPEAIPQTMEPEKCEGWSWVTFDELVALRGDSKPGDVLFLPLHHLLEQVPDMASLRP